MIRRTASALALILGLLCGSAAAQIIYVGSATIGENIIPEAAKAFTDRPCHGRGPRKMSRGGDGRLHQQAGAYGQPRGGTHAVDFT
jgi:hypothetical protein